MPAAVTIPDRGWIPAGELKVGSTKDRSRPVQIQPGKECAITTPARPGEAVHTQFMNAVAGAAKPEAIAEQTPNGFTATIGKTFTFGHDRRGGEAYVMTSKD